MSRDPRKDRARKRRLRRRNEAWEADIAELEAWSTMVANSFLFAKLVREAELLATS